MWSAEDTTPQAIADALQELLHERHADGTPHAPARVLNLIVIVDARFRGETANKLEHVGHNHPSRTIMCAVEPERKALDAWVTIECETDAGASTTTACRERIEIRIGDHHLPHLDTIVHSLLVSDLLTVAWAPHRHEEGINSVSGLSDVVLFDSVDEPSVTAGLRRAGALRARARVVDLAWLRCAPWRERISGVFDPPAQRPALEQISELTVRHGSGSGMVGILLVGWLGSRLEWKPRALLSHDGTLQGRLRGRRQHVEVRLEPVADLSVPGLSGVSVETASGASWSLDRSEGGLAAVQKGNDGGVSEWTMLGASRGEAGIFGEGIRQTLLHETIYSPALEHAQAMLSEP